MQLIESFLNMLKVERHVAANTIEAYRSDLVSFISGREDIFLINQESVAQYIISLSTLNYSERSIHRKVSAIRHFFEFLIDEGMVHLNPCLDIDLPKTKKLLPKALTLEEIKKMIEICILIDSNAGKRLKAMLEILYATGIRVSELLQLKLLAIREIDIEQPFIIINGKGSKERVVLLNRNTIIAIKEYLDIRLSFCRGIENEWLFPSITQKGGVAHLTRQRLGQLLKEIAIQANIAPERVSPHVLRHSFASHLLQNGAEIRVVQELLGHSDISSTQIYTQIIPSRAHKFVLENHPINYWE